MAQSSSHSPLKPKETAVAVQKVSKGYPPEVLRKLKLIPPLYRGVYELAMSGRSRKNAIKCQCLDCCGWSWREVIKCSCVDCSLYPYRPYQKLEK